MKKRIKVLRIYPELPLNYGMVQNNKIVRFDKYFTDLIIY